MTDPEDQVDEATLDRLDRLDAIHEGHQQQLGRLCGCSRCVEYRKLMGWE